MFSYFLYSESVKQWCFTKIRRKMDRQMMFKIRTPYCSGILFMPLYNSEKFVMVTKLCDVVADEFTYHSWIIIPKAIAESLKGDEITLFPFHSSKLWGVPEGELTIDLETLIKNIMTSFGIEKVGRLRIYFTRESETVELQLTKCTYNEKRAIPQISYYDSHYFKIQKSLIKDGPNACISLDKENMTIFCVDCIIQD